MAFGFLLAGLFLAVRTLFVHSGQARALSKPEPQGGLFETASECTGLLAFGVLAIALGASGSFAWPALRALGAGILLVFSAPLVALIADLVPRSLAPADPGQQVPGPARRMTSLVDAALQPFRWLQAIGLRLSGARGEAATPVTLAEAAAFIFHRQEPEEAAMSERRVVRRLLAFAATSVRDVMMPLSRIYAVRDDSPVAAAIEIVRGQAFSRLPVYHERMFNIVGIIHAFDLLAQESLERPLSAIMRPPLYVPQTKKARDLLPTMQKLGINMAVVVDEHGGAVGIITVEDLVEEIVGEIEDEYDVREELCQQLSDNLFRIEAGMEIAQLNERFGWALPSGDYETIGGLMMTRLGRIPKKGETLDLGQLRIEVADADARTVRQVLVRTAK